MREKSLPLKDFDKTVHDLMAGMAEIMYAYKGIGLAHSRRVFFVVKFINLLVGLIIGALAMLL